MEPRARTRLNLRRAGILAALAALLVPAVAGPAQADAAKRKKKRAPVVLKVTPTTASVGETLTIRGRHFRRGRNKNSVLFKRRRAKAVFVKARIATRKMLKVELPKRLEEKMFVEGGVRVATRFKLRVLGKRLGRKWAKGKRRRPMIGPEKPPAPPAPPEAAPDGDCDGDGAANRVDGDDDNDLLSDALEAGLKLNACNADTDGDTVTDGYEYQSARDLNDDLHQELNEYLPHPDKRPYPNALDAGDAHTDHDGDSLTLAEEFALWNFTGQRSLANLTYSAGRKYSAGHWVGGRWEPTLRADGYHRQQEFLAWGQARGYARVMLADVSADIRDPSGSADPWAPRTSYDIRDFNRDGAVLAPEEYYYTAGGTFVDDAQRDEDADGLSNWQEISGCMNRGLWDKLYEDETTYPLQYPGTLPADPDTDGDGIRDGADDQDHDDVPNVMECSRGLAHGDYPTDPTLYGRAIVNPFNPCLPHNRSRSCRPYVTVGEEWAPFNPEDVFSIKN